MATKNNKRQKKKNGASVQELLGINAFTEYGIQTNRGELLFFKVRPTNISVLSQPSVETKIRQVEYADKKEIIDGIVKKYRPDLLEEEEDAAGRCLPGGMSQTESRMHEAYRRSEKAVPIRTAPPGRRGNG